MVVFFFCSVSGLDTTLLTLAVALGIDETPLLRKIPNYASSIVVELWTSEERAEAAVLIYYRSGSVGHLCLVIIAGLSSLRTRDGNDDNV